jgi:hypothetical protein
MKAVVLGLVAVLGFSSVASADCGDDARQVIEKNGFTVRETFLEEDYYPELTNGVKRGFALHNVARVT